MKIVWKVFELVEVSTFDDWKGDFRSHTIEQELSFDGVTEFLLEENAIKAIEKAKHFFANSELTIKKVIKP